MKMFYVLFFVFDDCVFNTLVNPDIDMRSLSPNCHLTESERQ